jgi:hypothetical protein
MKAAEIRNNLRQTDHQYKLDQANSKLKNIETKMNRAEEGNKKAKAALE